MSQDAPKNEERKSESRPSFAQSFFSASSSQSLYHGFPEGPPLVEIYGDDDYTTAQWKNGLGSTTELAIRPFGRDYTRQSFIWRLSLSEIKDSCNQTMLPGYDISTILLPHGKSYDNAIHLHHNGLADSVKLFPLTPYTHSGHFATTLKIDASPQRFLSFTVNPKLATVSMSVETIYPLNSSEQTTETLEEKEDAAEELDVTDHERQSTTNKFLLGRFTILYVISGQLRVSVDNESEQHLLKTGQTLICEREHNSSPTDMSMTPVIENGKLTDSPLLSPVDGDNLFLASATVLIIQMQVFKSEREHTQSEVAGPLVNQLQQPVRFPRDRQISFVSDEQLLDQSVAGGNATGKHWESAHKYRPPVFSARYQNESDVPPPVVRDSLIIEDFPPATISTAWINMVKEGLSEWIRIPVIIARGAEPGHVVGITAVVHGNELNGVPCIHRVITDIDVHQLKGTVVAVPCVNVPGYLRFCREFSDGKDLNRNFPGALSGTASQVYNHNFFEKVIKKLDFLIDLHTASFGRVNSYYVRADMNDPISATMAKLQQPQIILHNSGQDGALFDIGTLRSAAAQHGIKAITVEIGNPQLFHYQFVQWSYMGVMRILHYLKMFTKETDSGPAGPTTLLCSKGFWIYTRTGGVLEVYPHVNTIVRKGDLIARIKNIFGNIVDEMFSTHSGVVIGRSSNPVAMAGDRVVHLGILKKENEVLPKEAKENY